MSTKLIISLSAIAGIVILSTVALFKGIDGAVLMSSFAIVGGIAGFVAGKKI